MLARVIGAPFSAAARQAKAGMQGAALVLTHLTFIRVQVRVPSVLPAALVAPVAGPKMGTIFTARKIAPFSQTDVVFRLVRLARDGAAASGGAVHGATLDAILRVAAHALGVDDVDVAFLPVRAASEGRAALDAKDSLLQPALLIAHAAENAPHALFVSGSEREWMSGAAASAAASAA